MTMTDRQKHDLNTMCSSAYNIKLGDVIEDVQKSPIPNGTPVNAEVAEALFVIAAGENAANEDTVTIGDVTYEFVTDLSEDSGEAVPNEVKIGVDNDTTAANLAKAINAGVDEGTAYGTGTEEHPDVTAEAGKDTDDNNEVRVTAKTKGAAANDISLAETGTHLSWSAEGDYEAENLTGGVDGTVAEKWQQYLDADYVYVATDDNTVSDTNWKRISLSTY